MTAAATAATASAPPLLAVRGLRYDADGHTIASLAELTLYPGDHALLMGPSGSGKSTLLQLIAGLRPATAGSVAIAGQDLAAMTPSAIDALRGRRIGIVFQTLHLVAALTVRQNLRLAQSLAGLPVDESRVDDTLDGLGIAHLAGRRPSQLSHGEAQRAAIARAVINSPDLILADEPTSALDDANCQAVVDLLRNQATESGATLLIATHDARLADRFEHRIDLGMPS